MPNEVVAHFADGQLVKGTSLDVDPGKPRCHVRTADGRTVPVALNKLKALFFVRDLTGDPARTEASAPDPADPRRRGAFLIEITFKDGERMVGLTNRYPPNRPFFFILPADPKSNNIRILVNRAEVKAMKGGGGGVM
ncbi:MAG: DUF6982 domain-containing protein [Gemmatimonadota bacterium]